MTGVFATKNWECEQDEFSKVSVQKFFRQNSTEFIEAAVYRSSPELFRRILLNLTETTAL